MAALAREMITTANEIAGWRISPVFLAQSGAPFTVNLGVDQANIGAGPAQRPDQTRDSNLPADQ